MVAQGVQEESAVASHLQKASSPPPAVGESMSDHSYDLKLLRLFVRPVCLDVEVVAKQSLLLELGWVTIEPVALNLHLHLALRVKVPLMGW